MCSCLRGVSRWFTPLACGPGSPESSKSHMDMASKLFTFTFTFTFTQATEAPLAPANTSASVPVNGMCTDICICHTLLPCTEERLLFAAGDEHGCQALHLRQLLGVRCCAPTHGYQAPADTDTSYKRVKGRSHTVEKRKASHPQKPHATSQPRILRSYSSRAYSPHPVADHDHARIHEANYLRRHRPAPDSSRKFCPG